jgi:type I restriction enzyme M protein
MNPLNDNDLKDFLSTFSNREITSNSWIIDVDNINQKSFDLSVINPNKEEEIFNLLPSDLLDEIETLDESTKSIIKDDSFIENLNSLIQLDSSTWEKTTLSKCCDFFNGKAHEKVIDEDDDYIVVNSKFISTEGATYKRTKEQLFPLFVGDIVMVMSDVPNGKALAKCYLIDEDDIYMLIPAILTTSFQFKVTM